MTASGGTGIIDTPSNHSVDQTVERLKGILQAKGVTLFALVDHSGEAEKVGMKMPPTKLLIFGSPKAGTPLMLAAPSIAIDLPLKILIWEDAHGKVWVTYNSPVREARPSIGPAAKYRGSRSIGHEGFGIVVLRPSFAGSFLSSDTAE
jgi:uncharacterized protein (DUF302 family)